MFVYPQNSYVESLTPNVLVSSGGAFGGWLGHEGGDLMNGINALTKETPDRSSPETPSAIYRHSERAAVHS